MLSDSTERLGVLRPLSLPPARRAAAAGEGEGSKAECFKRERALPGSPTPRLWGRPRLCPGTGVWPPATSPQWAQDLLIQPRAHPSTGPVAERRWLRLPGSRLALPQNPTLLGAHSGLLLCPGWCLNPAKGRPPGCVCGKDAACSREATASIHIGLKCRTPSNLSLRAPERNSMSYAERGQVGVSGHDPHGSFWHIKWEDPEAGSDFSSHWSCNFCLANKVGLSSHKGRPRGSQERPHSRIAGMT